MVLVVLPFSMLRPPAPLPPPVDDTAREPSRDDGTDPVSASTLRRATLRLTAPSHAGGSTAGGTLCRSPTIMPAGGVRCITARTHANSDGRPQTQAFRYTAHSRCVCGGGEGSRAWPRQLRQAAWHIMGINTAFHFVCRAGALLTPVRCSLRWPTTPFRCSTSARLPTRSAVACLMLQRWHCG